MQRRAPGSILRLCIFTGTFWASPADQGLSSSVQQERGGLYPRSRVSQGMQGLVHSGGLLSCIKRHKLPSETFTPVTREPTLCSGLEGSRGHPMLVGTGAGMTWAAPEGKGGAFTPDP